MMDRATSSSRRARRLTAATALAVTALVFAAGQSLAGVSGEGLPLPLLGTTTTTSTTTTVVSPTTPPTPPATADPDPALPQADGQVQDGSALVVQSTYGTPCGCVAGTYVLSGRLRGEGARAWLTVDGRRVGEWALDGAYREVQAVVALAGPAAMIGVESVSAHPGAQPTAVLVDWLRVTPTALQYTTSGRDIRGPDGNPTVMLGIAKGGFEYNPLGHALGDSDAAQLGSWGASVVRLFVSQEFSDPSSCQYDSGYLDRVQGEVDVLNARGMYVIIDDHYSQAGDPCAVGENLAMADDGSIAFWLDVANRYKDNPMLGFDLYNEPHDVSWEVWRNGGDAGGFHTPGMQALYDTVRSTGATNVVFISGPSWGNDLRPALEMPIDGSGIVYAAHTYCFDCNTDSNGMPGYFEAWMAPTVAEYPVMILEFGVASYDLGMHNRRVISWAKEHGLGWTAYSWTNISSSNRWGLLRQSGGYQPSLNGLPVRNALRAAAG